MIFKFALKWIAILVLALVAISCAMRLAELAVTVYRYGWASLFPSVDLRDETRESMAKRIQPGVTKRSELFPLFGEPDALVGKRTFPGGPQGNLRAEQMTHYRSLQWRKFAGFYLIISMSSKTDVLTVYLNDDDTVHEFELSTEY